VASVVAVAVLAVLLSLTAAAGWVGAAVIARHRAQAAADLAALGAAGAVTSGPDAACGRAEEIASAMRTSVTGCWVDDLDVVVTVEAPMPIGRWGPARAEARAGPADVY
jgi:secretion/DNA translocation related TadE-like protein